MSKFTPWSQEQAEAWAEEITNPLNMSDSQFSEEFRVQKERGKSLFLAGLAKAAEMIEASPTVYGGIESGHYWETVQASHDTHTAKLMNIEPIDSKEVPDDQA